MKTNKIIEMVTSLIIIAMLLPIGLNLFNKAIVNEGSTTISDIEHTIIFFVQSEIDTSVPTNITIDYGSSNSLIALQTDIDCIINGTFYPDETTIVFDNMRFPISFEIESNSTTTSIIFMSECDPASQYSTYVGVSGMSVVCMFSNATSWYWNCENYSNIDSQMHLDAEHEMVAFNFNEEHESTAVSASSDLAIIFGFEYMVILMFVESEEDYVDFFVEPYSKTIIPDAESPHADYLILIPIFLTISILLYFIPKINKKEVW